MTAPTAPPYNTNNVLVGPAALYFAPVNTPLPADSSVLFDPTNWTGKTLTANGATAVTLAVTTAAGTQTTSSQTLPGTAAAFQTALAGLSNVGAGNVTVTGAAGGPYTIVFANSLGAVTLAVTGSTGGTPTVTGGLWTPAGATDAGWTFGKSINIQDINIEEQGPPVGRFVTSSSYSISGTILEASRANWQLALNAVKTLIAAGAGGSGIPGVNLLTMQDALVHYAVALESKNEYGFATRDYIPDAVQGENVSVVHRRAAAAKGLAVAFTSVCPVGSIVSRGVNTATP
jgi:hypothetical protein